MSDKQKAENDKTQPMVYQVRIEGHLSPMWQDEFEGWTITENDAGETVLTGAIADQAALHGLFKRIRNLGITLVEVKRITGSGSDQS